MSRLNAVLCNSVFTNTGIGDCYFTPTEIKGLFIVPSGFVINESDLSNLFERMFFLSGNVIKGQRIYPVHGFVGMTDSSEEPVRETLGYGASITLRDGNYNWTLRFTRGGLCLLKNLQKLNGQKVNVIFYDGAGNLFGTKDQDGNLSGIPLTDFWANKWQVSDGAGAFTNLSVFLSFEPRYINQNISFVKSDFDLSLIEGIKNLELKIELAHNVPGAGVPADSLIVRVGDECTGDTDSFYDLFLSQMLNPNSWEITYTSGGVFQGGANFLPPQGNSNLKAIVFVSDGQESPSIVHLRLRSTALLQLGYESQTFSFRYEADI